MSDTATNYRNAAAPNLSPDDDWPRCGFLAPHCRLTGTIKTEPADFEVEELPLYEPSGEGEHLLLFVEKTDVAAEQLVTRVAAALRISREEIGVAGLKDRRAVTRQWLSAPARTAALIDQIDQPGLRVLRVERHRHKLRPGHLRGNRFRILVRGPCTEAQLAGVTAALATCRQRGFANYFGEQRFGRDQETLHLGIELLSGRRSVADLPRSRRKFLLRLALSAVQSHLFNMTLAERVRDGLLWTVLPGDVLQKRQSGGAFVVRDASAEQLRLDAGELVISGPLFGPKLLWPTGLVEARERRVLDQAGIPLPAFDNFPRLTTGARRPLTVLPTELAASLDPLGWRLSFVLPPGSYATTLLAEFMVADRTRSPSCSAETDGAEVDSATNL